MIANLLNRISELEQQIVELKAEVEKEEKENKRWRAEKRDTYWFVDGDGTPKWWHEYSRDIDGFYYDTHNYFQTEEKAQKYANILETERQLKKFADKHNNAIDWSDNNQEKWNLCYYYSRYEVSPIRCCMVKEARVIYFSSEEIAEQAIKTIGEDKIKDYLTYEW